MTARDGRRRVRQRAEADRATGWAAACMEPAEWALWQALIRPDEQVARPCDECPLGFAADMRGVGRCNGEPGGVAEDIEPIEEEQPMPTPITVTTTQPRRLDLQLEAPCERCVHSAVCRILQELERIDTLTVPVPVLDDLVEITLAATITCGVFTPAKGKGTPAKGRTLNLSPEERERRRQSAYALQDRQRAAREAAAS